MIFTIKSSTHIFVHELLNKLIFVHETTFTCINDDEDVVGYYTRRLLIQLDTTLYVTKHYFYNEKTKSKNLLKDSTYSL